MQLDPGSDGVGVFHLHPALGTHVSSHSEPLLTATLFRTPPWPPNTWQATGWGMGGAGALPQWHGAGRGCERRLLAPPPRARDTPPTYGFGEEPGEEQRREGQERSAAGGQGALRLSLRQRFYPFFPFSYVKSARKLSSLFTRVSSVSWGRGQGNPRPGTPAQLKVASYCLETWVSF